MSTPSDHSEKEEKISIEKQNRINAHIRIASHLERAAKHYYDAAKYNENNDMPKAVKSAMVAHEHLTQANELDKIEADKDVLTGKIEAIHNTLYNKK